MGTSWQFIKEEWCYLWILYANPHRQELCVVKDFSKNTQYYSNSEMKRDSDIMDFNSILGFKLKISGMSEIEQFY